MSARCASSKWDQAGFSCLAARAQSYQHVYLALLYGLLAIKSVLVDDFTALAEGVIGSVRVKPLTRGEAAVLWGGKALYAAWFLALPALFSGHSWAGLAALWLTAEAVAGWTLAFMFQVPSTWRRLQISLSLTYQLAGQPVSSSTLAVFWVADACGTSCTHTLSKAWFRAGFLPFCATGSARGRRRRVPPGRSEDRQGAARLGRRAGRHLGGLRARLVVLDTLQRRPQLPGAPLTGNSGCSHDASSHVRHMA